MCLKKCKNKKLTDQQSKEQSAHCGSTHKNNPASTENKTTKFAIDK